MLNLYYKPSCPFCQRVLGEVEAMGIKLHLKDISSDPVLREELIARGGKQQVPYLADTDKEIEMYESEDIIAYLQKLNEEKTDSGEFSGLKVHTNPDVCETCE